MSFGIVEVIALLLGLAGFGLTANPRAPTADQTMQYALADPDVAAHIDAASVIPGNYKLLSELADRPQIRASPDLQAMVRKAVGEVEGGRGVAKLTTGIDVATDISDATAFVQLVPQAEPRFVLAVHGRFTADNIAKIAKLSGKSPARLGSGTIVEGGGAEPAIALTKDGVLLVGTAGLVRERLADDWKPPGHGPGTNLGYLAEAIAARPVLAVVLTMSAAARGEALSHLDKPGFASDLVSRHKAAAFSIFQDGIGWTWIDSSKAGLDAMELISNGVLDVLRAAQIAPRGIAKIAMGALDSYGGNPQLDELIKHKADIQKVIEAYSGDGNFKVKLDKNARSMRLAVRATGKTVSEVLPIGLIVPAAIGGFVMATRVEQPAPVMAAPVPAARPSPVKSPAGKPPAAIPPAKRP